MYILRTANRLLAPSDKPLPPAFHQPQILATPLHYVGTCPSHHMKTWYLRRANQNAAVGRRQSIKCPHIRRLKTLLPAFCRSSTSRDKQLLWSFCRLISLPVPVFLDTTRQIQTLGVATYVRTGNRFLISAIMRLTVITFLREFAAL